MSEHEHQSRPIFTEDQLSYLEKLSESHKRPNRSESERAIWWREGRINLVEQLRRESETLATSNILSSFPH